MENNHDIDKTFNEASKNLEEPATFPGFDKVWAKVEEKLDKKQEKKRKVIPVWIPYGIAASLLIASGILYFTDKKQNNVKQQEVMAAHMSIQDDISAESSAPVQRIDSLVKMNIQNKTLAVPSENIIAYHAASKPKTLIPASPVSEMNAAVASKEEAEKTAEKKMMAMDSLKRQNIEEVIAMGMRKEKASMNAMASSQKVSSFNTVGDTAESSYPNLAFKETEIKSYNKVNVKAQKPLAFNPVTENRLAEKADTSMFKTIPGLNTNAVSGRSNKAEGSINIRGTAQTNQQNPIIIIDGKVSDMKTFRTLDSKHIDEVIVLKDDRAALLFPGEKTRNGVIVVITKSISPKEKKKLKKILSKNISEK